jgi:hypothetical protein
MNAQGNGRHATQIAEACRAFGCHPGGPGRYQPHLNVFRPPGDSYGLKQMARNKNKKSEPQMAEIDDLWEIAESALAEARAMPWGPKRVEALREAGILRSRAAEKQALLDSRRASNPRVRQDWTFMQKPAEGSESTET